MTLDEALATLQSDRSADLTTVRARYRRLIRRHHPDVAGDAGQARTAQLNQAWTVVQRTAPWPVTQERAEPTRTSTATDQRVGAAQHTQRLRDRPDVVLLPAATSAVFETLLDAADRLGDLSYADRQDGILETIIRPEGGPSCSLLLTLRQQGPDTVAECVLESLEARTGPPITDVVAQLIALLPAAWRRDTSA